jgi:hypothetical protein
VRRLGHYLRQHHLALFALLLATTGTSYAAATRLLSKNSVKSPQVVNHSLQTVLSRKAIKALHGLRGAPGAAGPQGPKGPQGPQGLQGRPGADFHYAHVVVVKATGTPAANGASLVQSLGAITDNASHPYLVQLEPGTYDVGATTFELKPNVDLAGSGAAVTTITGHLFSVPQSPNGGEFLAGAAGDGPTLVYGKTTEVCDDINVLTCHRLDAVGGLSFVTGQYQAPMIPGIPAPLMLAFTAHDPQSSMRISQGLVAVVPAATPVLSDFDNVPRVAANGPVEVFRVLGPRPAVHLVSSVTPVGSVKAIALDFRQLAVLVERADGTKALIRYATQSGAVLGTSVVPKAAASELSVGKAGIVYRVGARIYLVGTGGPRLVWKASGTPIGLSIEGRRIAWAENSKGRGRVLTLTLG